MSAPKTILCFDSRIRTIGVDVFDVCGCHGPLFLAFGPSADVAAFDNQHIVLHQLWIGFGLFQDLVKNTSVDSRPVIVHVHTVRSIGRQSNIDSIENTFVDLHDVMSGDLILSHSAKDLAPLRVVFETKQAFQFQVTIYGA